LWPRNPEKGICKLQAGWMREVASINAHAALMRGLVIDKQMDSLIQLGVIEPSQSPWAAPVFIVYRNGKPRKIIDLRKLNDVVIMD
jgi:hypothetical protein